ncbi:MAG: helix-turn-helix domain-containing protein [Alphaproteobacteria bacterium]|nr:helix-turn-helix domain-containing protein [Alphaproteobacteria bacterium]
MVAKPGLSGPLEDAAARNRCRTNSRRGITDPAQRSYPPVESVCRALDVLRAVNKLGIASVSAVFEETGLPKPTIVRMLETLSAEGYVARDNMCGGYRVTSRVHELNSGYQGVARVIEISRPLAIDLTQRIKWPIGIGVIDGDAIALKFWTGAISPWAHTNTVLGLRPDLVSTAMGRAYLAYCTAAERERHLGRLRADPSRGFGDAEERQLRAVLDQVVADGFAKRDPRTKPYRTTTLAMPIRQGGEVHALISISFFTTAVPRPEIGARVVAPLRETVDRIEAAFAVANGMPIAADATAPHIEPDF